VKEGATEAFHYVKAQTRAATQRAKEKASQVAKVLVESVQDEAERLYGWHKALAVSRISGLGNVAKQTAHALHAVKADAAAEYLEKASRRAKQARVYLDEQPFTEMMQDAGELVRKNRVGTAGALFLLGFATVRFLKATAKRPSEDGNDDVGEQAEPAMAPEPRGRRARKLRHGPRN
jgi:hypothetical protein